MHFTVPRLKLSIKFKFLIVLILLVTPFLVLTDYIWISRVRPILLNKAIESQKTQADRLAFRVRNHLDAKVRFLILLTQSSVFLEQKTNEQTPELQTALLQDADLMELSVLDRTGLEINKVSRGRVYAPEELTNRSDDLAYKFAAFGYGKEYFSKVSFEGNNPVMVIALPILPSERQRTLDDITTEIDAGETPAFLTQTGIMVAKIDLKNIHTTIEGVRETEQVFIISSDGSVLSYKTGPPTQKLNITESPLSQHFTQRIQHVHSLSNVTSILDPTQEVYSTHATIPDLNWLVLVEEPTAVILSDVNNVVTLAISIVVVGVFLIFLASIIISRSFTKPIEQLSQTANSLSQGDFSKRVLITTGDELENLANAFNSMAATIQKQIDDLKKVDSLKDEFIALVSHNLRTPLTAIKGYIEAVGESKALTDEDKVFITKLNTNVNVLQRLIEEVLSISSIGPNGIRLNLEPVDVGALVNDCFKEVEYQSNLKSIKINVSVQPNLPPFILDKNRLQDVIVNLLDNAIKFSPEKSVIELTVKQVANEITLSVKDQGIGIDAAEVPALFQKFHRATDYMTYHYQGVGLGLYFSKLVIESHGGKIWVDSAKGQGATFTFTLPITKPSVEGQAVPQVSAGLNKLS